MSSSSHSNYDAFARRIVDAGVISDPWFDGKPRFREDPLILPAKTQRAMYLAAEEIGAVYDELCHLVADDDALLDDFFCLTPYQKLMWQASRPLWHGLARADVFVTSEGLAIAELNCDTPTGEAEAVTLGRLVAPNHPGTRDPNAELEGRFVAMVDALAEGELEPGVGRDVGLVYPTEFTEDLSLVRLYKQWFESRGRRVVLGSPYNLQHDEGALSVFDAPFQVLVRHYKTDWWAERASPWTDETVPDIEPLREPLAAVFAAQAEGRCVVVNPFGAVLPQNKRSMAFMWEHLHRFSPHAQTVIERYVPISARLETLHEEQLRVQRAEWVIKSDYGAEGDEVVIGATVSDATWREALSKARPGRFIAQRYFAAETDAAGATINYGVYLVAGEACGLYAREQAGATDAHALSVPVLIDG